MLEKWSHCQSETSQITLRVDQNLMSYSCVHNFIILTESPTPMAEMQPQTIIEPPVCFSDGCRHLLLHLCPDFTHMIWVKNIKFRFIHFHCHHFWRGFSKKLVVQLNGKSYILGPRLFFSGFLLIFSIFIIFFFYFIIFIISIS